MASPRCRDSESPGAGREQANIAVARYFADYEREHDLPVVRPVRVDRVSSEGDLLMVAAGERIWAAPTIINATGTWDRPFVSHYPGIETFLGEPPPSPTRCGSRVARRYGGRTGSTARPDTRQWRSSRSAFVTDCRRPAS